MANLFKPIQVGQLELKHRVVLAPLTRIRADEDGTPNDMMLEYYTQRAREPGTLLITEATRNSPLGGILADKIPAVDTKENIAGWNKVTKAVHEKGSFIFLQLWLLGKSADPESGSESATATDNIQGQTVATMTFSTEEIELLVEDSVQGAKNAIEAGFDGVEIHAAMGYLVNQFLDPVNNKRTDQYGGSIENRARFLLEIVDGVIGAIGADRTAVRLSPWFKLPSVSYGLSPIPQWSYVISELEARAQAGKKLAYLHAVEPRVIGADDVVSFTGNNDWIRLIWSGVLLRAGGFQHDSAVKAADADDKTLIVFGRYFISNPDLVAKLRANKPLTHYIRDKFYTSGPEGYIDYPVDES